MAGEINITGAFADALPSPVAASGTRSGTQRPAAAPRAPAAPDTTTPQRGAAVENEQTGYSKEATYLSSMLQRVQSAIRNDDTTLSFERDNEDGQMYLHVKDKLTGEEIYRIPKHYLKNVDTHPGHNHRVDVRI